MELRLFGHEQRLPVQSQLTSPIDQSTSFDCENRKHRRRRQRRQASTNHLSNERTSDSSQTMQFKLPATSQSTRREYFGAKFKTKTKSANRTTTTQQRQQQARHTLYTSCTILFFTLIIYLGAAPTPTQAFNIDTQSAVVHTGPEDSYFGYSVAEHRDRGVHWILAGAPKAQTDQPKTRKSGAVYRCAANNSKACQQIVFDPNGSSEITLRNEKVQADDKSHQWFGASLQSATENGSIVACAPRYVYYSTNLKRRDPVGTCWVSRGSFSGFLEYSPCRLNGK